ncbi:9-O-acetylesterase [candidate division KSB1 bacterium]|nr:9-O-acetylesterase [candidate division KSB1 bacterium]
MKLRMFDVLFIFVLMLLLVSCSQQFPPATNVTMPAMFADHMVLQQGIPVPVWGSADPGGQVIVEINGQSKRGVVKSDGSWKIKLNSMTAGGPFTMTVVAADTTTIQDVLVGEVWICSGQSNMEFPVVRTMNAETEIANANYSDIRLFIVDKDTSITPRTDVTSEGWKLCSPETVGPFSAVGYFFGRDIHTSQHVPVGLIGSYWGGTPAEAWTSSQGLKKLADFRNLINIQGTRIVAVSEIMQFYMDKIKEWQDKVDNIIAEKYPLIDFENWNTVDFDATNWDDMQLPQFWNNAGLKDYTGIVRFRKLISLPNDFAGKPLKVHVGAIDEADIAWFNGVIVGAADDWDKKRVYNIPDSLIHVGQNVIAIQVANGWGLGGMYGPAEDMYVETSNGWKLPLEGDWKYCVTLPNSDVPGRVTYPIGPNGYTMLYNGMIAPLIPYGIRGAIWYQGESNAERAYQYRSLFSEMIMDWRMHWKEGNFPFLFVQLANYNERTNEPVDDSWAELREAQTMALLLPNTGIAVTVDIGDAVDIHPTNKQEVGRRLALNARSQVYGETLVYSGPIYKDMVVEDGKIRLSFYHVGGGLVAKGDDSLKGFAIAGADHKFVWADAKIDGNDIIVSSPDVTEPVAVRYAWAANPECNLYNKEELPASPFRTDDWEGVTFGKK